MSKEVVKAIFDENIAGVREDLTFDAYFDSIKGNEEYKKGLFENYVNDGTKSYEEFNAETFGVGKPEAPSEVGGAESFPTESVSSEFEVGPPGVEPKGAPVEEAAALVGGVGSVVEPKQDVEPAVITKDSLLDVFTVEDEKNRKGWWEKVVDFFTGGGAEPKRVIVGQETFDRLKARQDEEIKKAEEETGEKVDLVDVIQDFVTVSPEEQAAFLMSIQRGLMQGQIAERMRLGETPTREDIIEIARLNKEQRGLKSSKSYERFNEAPFGEAVKIFLQDPLEIGGQIILESGAALARHGYSRALLGGGTGAAMGSVVPGIGTAAGFGTGVVSGLGVAGFNLEMASSILESFEEAGVDVTNQYSLESAFSDEETLKKARDFALKRSVPIALFDLFSAGVAGKIAKFPAKSIAKRVAKQGVEMTAQAGLAGTGEAAAQVVSGQKFNPNAILAEMIGETTMAVPEIAVGQMIENKKEGKSIKPEAVKIDTPVEAVRDMVDISVGAGLVTSKEANEIVDEYGKVQEVKKSIPENLRNNEEVVSAIEEKKKLEEEKKNLDPIFVKGVDEKIAALDAKIEGIVSGAEAAPVEGGVTEEGVSPETAEAPKVEIIAKRRQKLNRDRTKLVPTGGFDYFAKVGDKEVKLSDAEYKAYKESGVLPESVSAVEVEGEAVAPEAVAPEVPALRDVESTAKALEGKDTDKIDWVSKKEQETKTKNVNLKDGSIITLKYLLDQTPDNTVAYVLGIDKNGNQVSTVMIEKGKDGRWRGNDLSVDKKYRRKGLATAMYDYADELGHNLIPTKSLKPDGVKFWKNRNKKRNQFVSEAYHKAKEDGSNPELVSAVEELLGKPTQAPEAAEGQPAEVVTPEVAEVLSTEDATRIALESLEVLPEGIESAEEGARIYHEAIGKEERTEAEDAIVMAVEDAVIGGAVAPEVEVAEAVEAAEAPKPAEGKEPSDAQMETKIEEVSTITQIRPKNLRDLYKVNRELFGQNKIKALASAIAMDRMVGAMAKRSGITKAEMYGRLKFEKASEEFMKGLSADGKILYQIIGQNANLSETVRENLQVARDMEAAGKDAKTIRLATGWEKGKDGKWRYEIDDVDINDFAVDELQRDFQFGNENEVSLQSLIGIDNPLIKAYPKLGNIRVISKQDLDADASFSSEEQSIELAPNITLGSQRNFKSVLLHEIQHAIQDIEGFARGGNTLTYKKIDKYFGKNLKFEIALSKFTDIVNKQNNLINKYEKENGIIPKDLNIIEGYRNLESQRLELFNEMEKLAVSDEEAYDIYKRLAGEVEARNVQTRMGMTPEQRRGTLLSETEDVARDEQIVLFQKADNQARGAVMVSLDGQAAVYALTDPNVSTPLHEMAHIFEHYLTPSERNAVIRNAGTNGWTTETSEYFARGFERYLAEGSSPIAELNKVFAKFREWLVEIYNGIVGSDIDIELNPEMRKLYDTIFGETAETPRPAEGLTSKEKAEQYKKEAEEIAKKIRKNLRGRGGITGITPFSRAKRLAEVDRATLKLIKEYIYQKVLAGAYTFKDFVKDMKENSKRLFGVQIKVFSEDERIFDAGKALFEIDDTFAQEIMKLKDDFISSINNNPSSAGLNFDKFVAANQALVSGFIQAAESQYGLNNTQATSLVRSMYYDAISSVAGTKQSFETIQDIKDFHKKINDAEILNDALDVVRTEDIRRRLNVLSRTWNAFVDAFVSPTRTFDDIFRNVKDRLSLEREVYASRKSRMGSSTKAGNWYNEVHKKIYGGLSWSEIRELNKFLVYRRIREVKQLRDARVIEYNNLEKDLLVPGITDEDKAKIEKRMAELKELGLKRVMSGSVIVNGKKVNFEDYAADYAAGIEASDSASATKIKERAKLYTDANNELLKMRLDAGLISQEAYDSMIDKDYVRRVFLDLSASTLDAVSFPSISGQIRAIKSGSEEKFLLMDTQSLLQLSAAVTFSSVDKNKFMQKVAAWTENNQPVFLDKVLDSYKKAFEKKNGRQPTQDEIDKFTKEQTLFMLRRKNQAKPVGFELNTYYVNGKEKILAVRNDLQGVFDTPTGREGVKGRMKSFIDAMSVVNLTGLIKSSAVFYNLAFALTNFALDLIHASSITTDLYKSFYANIGTILAKATGYTAENVYSKAINGFNSLFARSGRRDSKFDRLVKDYFAHGGGMSSMSAPSTRMYTNSLMSDKLERAKSEFVKGTRKFFNALNSFQAGSELITRIIVYEAALNNNIKEYKKKNGIEPTGNDLTSLKESAAASAADLIDFREGTTITKSFDATAFPFLNAMVQGARVSNEFIRKNPGTAALRLTEFGGMALGVALYNANSGDEDEKEGIVGYNGISDYMKSNYLVIMMPYTKKNEKGEIVRPYVSLKLTAELKATNIMINGAVSKQGAKDAAGQFAEAIKGGYVPEIGAASPTAQAAFSLAANKDIFKKGAPIYRSREEVLLPDRFNVGETKKIYRDLFKAFYDFGNEDGEDKGILGFDEAGPAQWQAAFEKAISPNNPYYLFLTSTYATVSELAGEKNEREVKALFDEQMSSLNSITMRLYREPQSSIQQKNIKNKEELEFLEKQIGSWRKKNDDLITAVVAKKLRDIDNNPDLAMKEYDMLNFFQSDIFNYISDKEIERTVKAQGIKKLPEDFNRIIDFVVEEESRMMLKLYEEFKPNSISKYPSLKNYKEVKKGILELEQRTEAIEAMRDEYLTLPSNKRIEFLISLTFVAGDDFEDIVSLMGVDEESYDNYSEILKSAEAGQFKEQFLRTEDKYGQVSSEPALNKMLLIMELMKNK